MLMLKTMKKMTSAKTPEAAGVAGAGAGVGAGAGAGARIKIDSSKFNSSFFALAKQERINLRPFCHSRMRVQIELNS